MPVHTDSVIPVWLDGYDSEAYQALTNQEYWTYTNLEDAVLNPAIGDLEGWKTGWLAEFNKIASALNSWKNLNRETAIADMVSVLFGVKTVKNLYEFPLNTDNYSVDSMVTLTLFLNAIKSREVDFYKDYDNTGTMVSSKVATDIVTINQAGTTELSNLSAASTSLASSLKPYTHKLIFEEVPIVGVSSKKLVRDYIFDELGYTKYYTYLNVGVLQVPPPLE